MNYNNAIPIYLQIIDRIKKDIVTGTLVPGERMDSVRALADQYEVNLNTMQRACSELERQGYIFTQRGIGSFVTKEKSVIDGMKEEMSAGLIESFVSGMEGLGYSKDEILQVMRKVLEK